ncbi:cofactor-independent phosphoglycerate mutase [Desulforudis sp. DRI-14]|uniref:cofactor-independent phosphoglycerate mutase n=1 Tax=Desulforudis sp. DRI-14 TaxID=3459793 RepID=UPI0040437D6C
MKARSRYVIVLGDGMADTPRPELGGLTPLQYAGTPHMDRVAASGVMGLVRTVPEGLPPGSDVANLSVMGYDPLRYYTGRSPLEAVSMGVELGAADIAFRCNLVTLSAGEPYRAKTMVDYSAGEISAEEARELIRAVDEQLGGDKIRFYPGISYRHLMVWADGPAGSRLTPPHDISGRLIADYLPDGDGREELRDLMYRSWEILSRHPVNLARVARGLRPANSIWFWGQGKKPLLPPFTETYGLSGAVISAVDLIKGIGICAGMEVIEVPGATGNIHTNFRGKALAALEALARGVDFVYVHVEAPDEAGHQGDTQLKVQAIEAVDRLVLGEILKGLEEYPSYRVMVLPDHPTPISIRTHSSDPVPFAFAVDAVAPGGAAKPYSEEAALAANLLLPNGMSLMRRFLGIE